MDDVKGHLARAAAVLLTYSTTARAADGDAWFARDKAMHLAAGTVLGAGGYGAGALVFTSTRSRIGSGLALALGAGAAKEWHDRGGRGTPSWRDAAWDGVGAAAGVTLAWLIDRARHEHPSSARSPAASSHRNPGLPASPPEGILAPVARLATARP